MDEPPDEPLDERSAQRLADRARDTKLVLAIRAGDANAFGQIYDAWFDRVFDLTSRIVRDPDVAAEVTQDAFLSAWRALDSLDNPDVFGGWLLRIARNAAFDRSKKEGRSTAVDDQGLAMIESVGASPVSAPSGFGIEDRLGRAATPGAALEDSEAVSLVWEAASALPERDLEVLDLQLRHGLSPAEIGEVLGINRNAANQLVHRLRGRLETAIRARVLWRGGQPSCAVLTARLRDGGVTNFDAEAVRIVERHVPGCNDCDERQRLRLQPTALFAAAPLLIAPQLIKQSAASALEAAGVPMQGSAYSTSSLASASSAGSSSGGSGGSGGTGGGTGAGGANGATVTTLTVASESARHGGRALRNSFLAVAAALVVFVLVIGFASRTNDGTTTDLASGGPAATTSTPAITARPNTSVLPSTDGPTVVSTPGVTTGPTTPTSTSTPPNGPTTTRSTPGTVPKVTVVFALNPLSVISPWSLAASRTSTPPTLTWNVQTTAKVTVGIEGQEGGTVKLLLASDLTGSYVVCPGQRLFNQPATCTAAEGKYPYSITVYGADGTILATQTITLLVQPPPPPPPIN